MRGREVSEEDVENHDRENWREESFRGKNSEENEPEVGPA
jgi:hypothetical protein